jgi:hypothetical protein
MRACSQSWPSSIRFALGQISPPGTGAGLKTLADLGGQGNVSYLLQAHWKDVLGPRSHSLPAAARAWERWDTLHRCPQVGPALARRRHWRAHQGCLDYRCGLLGLQGAGACQERRWQQADGSGSSGKKQRAGAMSVVYHGLLPGTVRGVSTASRLWGGRVAWRRRSS